MQYCGIMYLYDYINDVTHIVILLRQHVQTHCLPEIQCCDIFFGRALLSYVKRCNAKNGDMRYANENRK